MVEYPQITALMKVAQEHPQWNWFAIGDSAQSVSVPGVLTGGRGQVACLLGATQGSPLAEKSPHLVRLNEPQPNDSAWEWIGRMGPRFPCVTVLASRLSFEALFEQLKQFTEIRLPDDYDMFFGFWDPAILGTLIGQEDDRTLHVKGPVFDEAQRRIFLAGLDGWWYWDREGDLHSIAIPQKAQPVRLPAPLLLLQGQVDDLVEASVPDHVLYFVDLNQAHLLNDIPPKKRYEYVKNAVNGARQLGLTGMRDMVQYVCITLIYKERIYEDKQIVDIFDRVRRGEIDFSAAMKLLP